MNIVFIHQYFYPEVAGAAIRLTELATSLAEQGFDIRVVTGLPSYTAKQKMPRKERYNNVLIERLPKTWFNKNTYFGRAINAVSFFLMAFFKILGTDRKAILFIGSDPPFLPVLGWLMKKIRGQSYSVLVFDIYPDLAVQLGYLKNNGWLAQLWDGLNTLSLSEAQAIVTAGKYMKKVLIKKLRNPREQSKIWAISTWENGDFIRPLAKHKNWFRQKYNLLEQTVVLYSGNMGLAHDLVVVIEAAELLMEHREITFLFIGGGGQYHRLNDLAAQKKLKNIRFLPYQPHDITPYSFTSGDIAIISMKQEVKGLCVPNKLHTALASGQAIVAIVPKETEIAEWIEEEKCGILVDSPTPRAIADAILDLHNDRARLAKYQQNARRAFESRFTKNQATQEYAALFRSFSKQIPELQTVSIE